MGGLYKKKDRLI